MEDMKLGPYEKMMGLLKEMQSALEGFKDAKQYENHGEEDKSLNDVMGEEHQGEPQIDDKSKKKMMMAMMLKKKSM